MVVVLFVPLVPVVPLVDVAPAVPVVSPFGVYVKWKVMSKP